MSNNKVEKRSGPVVSLIFPEVSSKTIDNNGNVSKLGHFGICHETRQSLCLLWTTFLEVLYTVHSLFNMPKFVSLLALKDTI
jgi:hypothetical protein